MFLYRQGERLRFYGCCLTVGCRYGSVASISKQIESELEYPGQVKVNIIRESGCLTTQNNKN